MKLGILLAACGLLLLGCGNAHKSVQSTQASAEPDPAIHSAGPWNLPAPREATAHTPPALPQYVLAGQHFFGAYATQGPLTQRVAADRHRAVFGPDWNQSAAPQPDDMAYAIYAFNLAYHEGSSRVELVWEETEPLPENVYLGVSNFETDRWHWQAAPAQMVLNLDDSLQVANENSLALVAVVVLGEQPAYLSEIVFGDRLYVENVDFSQLFSPPLSFETASLEADWAGRGTTPSSAEIIAETSLGTGHTRYAVSFTLDGLQQYGLVLVPPHAPGADLPVMIYCHPGVSGANESQLGQLEMLIADQELRNRFILIAPTFRGEILVDSATGVLTSDGPGSVYDRDADDALAMLNAVLSLFPEADASLVLTYGFSRGGQVAQRIAQRDPRIKGCVVFAGLTDEWTHWGQLSAYGSLLNMTASEPPVSDSWYHMLWELRFGHQDIWLGRMVLLKSSTSYFADRFPRIEAHYGELDTSIPIGQGERLNEVMLALGREAEFKYFVYPNAGHEMFFGSGSPARFSSFVASFIAED